MWYHLIMHKKSMFTITSHLGHKKLLPRIKSSKLFFYTGWSNIYLPVFNRYKEGTWT